MGEDLLDITPEQFEERVRVWLVGSADKLQKFDVIHRKVLAGLGGEYEIDIVVDLVMFGGISVRILVECKRYKRPVERNIMLIMHSKLQDLAAHKGIVFSTSGFQAGAVRYAKAHGIAAATVAGDETAILAKAKILPIPRTGFVGWLTTVENDDSTPETLFDHNDLRPIRAWLYARTD